MSRDDLVEQLKAGEPDLIWQHLPSDAREKLDAVLSDQRYEVDARAFLMFSSVRALLRADGMTSCESDLEAGRVIAHLNRR
ncbi:MAG TPA: hypothetical protein VL424_03140 [Pararobbsia sp.]|nr:hypothetical protein [Pararobbsia sp.]